MAKNKKRDSYRRKDDDEDYTPLPALSPETKKGILIVILFVLAFITIFSLFNLAGALGIYVKQFLDDVFGWGVYLFPIILIMLAYFLLRPEKYEVKPSNYLGLIIFILSYLGILQLVQGFEKSADTAGGGGCLGYYASYYLHQFMGPLASAVVLVALLIIAILIMFNTGLNILLGKINVFKRLKKNVAAAAEEVDKNGYIDNETESEEFENDDWISKATAAVSRAETVEGENEKNETTLLEEPEQASFIKKGGVPAANKKGGKKIPEDIKVTFAKNPPKHIQLPFSLLDGKTSKPTSGDIKMNLDKIKTTLENFGISVTMGEVNVGPTVTQFTLKPIDGVKLSNITSLQNDLAMALAAHPIRIEAPIPGKSLVGIEVPNQSIATVRLKEIMEDSKLKNKKGDLMSALGKDVTGKIWSIDLAALPHLLIAGATGSGKSVCINSLLISLLFNKSPEELKLILIDPKRVELTVYNGIPHLLTPVITEVNKTVNALRWAVKEMDERYKLLEATGKRNLTAYNASVITNRLPYIAIFIDELADLMAVAAKDIEAAIVRLAQMARAVGIHLVVATQRPSVNIITGLIKANITARIAFAVASGIDSRTILDFSGAEKLLGKGDMLYVSPELSKPKRLQGALVTDEEIERVTDFWRGLGEPEFNEEIVEKQTKVNLPNSSYDNDGGDELLEETKELILNSGKASASFLQRRLRVGYARAARLLDLLEEQGIIGPADGAKPREILVNSSVFYGESAGGKTNNINGGEEADEDNDDLDEDGDSENIGQINNADNEITDDEPVINGDKNEEENFDDDNQTSENNDVKIKIHY